MKKYIRNTAIALMTATALFSCDKFLEESPKDKLPEDEVSECRGLSLYLHRWL